jgi:hypothetical protein
MFVFYFTILSKKGHVTWDGRIYSTSDAIIVGGDFFLKNFLFPLLIIFIILSLGLQLLGLMNLLPFYVTSPILFLSFFILLTFLNRRKRFRGYKRF